MHSWGFALREGVFADTKEGKCKTKGKKADLAVAYAESVVTALEKIVFERQQAVEVSVQKRRYLQHELPREYAAFSIRPRRAHARRGDHPHLRK